jgi:hypothetical protein
VGAGRRIDITIVREHDEPRTVEVHTVKTECDGRPVQLISIRDITGHTQNAEAIISQKAVSS